MKSVMMHQFSRITNAQVPRSTFNRNSGHLTTFDAGDIIPIYWDRILPGDSVNMNMSGFFRMNTPVAPIMDNIFMDVHWFFCPNRLLWENFEKFCGAQDDPGDSTDYEEPKHGQNSGSTLSEDVIGAYLGVPINTLNITDMISALPVRMYRKIWNEWYRDENLQDSLTEETGDGPDSTSYLNASPLKRGKRKDYFTSALPWPQKGEEILIPFSGDAPISGIGKNTQNFIGTGGLSVYETDGTGAETYADWGNIDYQTHVDYRWHVEEDPNNAGFPNIRADLDNANITATINDLRLAFQLQKLLERDARGGTRYQEVILSHYGVLGEDARLQRVEYLGGGTIKVNINPVAQTSRSETGETPQGTMAAFATASGTGIGFTKSFTEHGWIMGLISARADLRYQQGIDRQLMHTTRYDYPWPVLAHLGEQEILNAEIMAQGTSDDDEVFGYQERYAEYRYKKSLVSGSFNSGATTPYDYYHLAQEFGTLPVLDSDFIEEDPPMDRIMAVTSEPDFIADMYFNCRMVRPLPMYGTPGLIDHF